jgi:hypothetical protein
MEDQESYMKARRRVHELKGYYVHLITFLLVNLFLFAVNMYTSPDVLWFYWPLFGWGIGIASHTMSVFGREMFFGRNWEDRKIKEIMDKEKSSKVS